MAVDELEVRIGAETRDFVSKLRALSGQTDSAFNKMGKGAQGVGEKGASAMDSIKKAALSMGAAAAGIFAFRALAGQIGESIKAANEQDAANVKLRQSLASVGDTSDATFQALQRSASGFQATTTAADEVVTGVQALLISMGRLKDTSAIDRATQATLDFAAATGTDLQAAGILMAKAAQGNTAAMSRYGIMIDENIPKSEKFAAVLSMMEKNFGGTAQAVADTAGGSMTQFKNTVGEIREEIGFMINDLMGHAMPSLKEGASTMRDLMQFIREDSEGTLGFTMQILGRVGNGISGVFKGAGVIVTGVLGGIFKGIEFIGKWWTNIVDFVLSGLQFLVHESANILNKIPGVNIDTSGIEGALARFRATTIGEMETVTGAVGGMADTAFDMTKVQFDSMKGSFSDMTATLDTIKPKVAVLPKSFTDMGEAAVKATDSMNAAFAGLSLTNQKAAADATGLIELEIAEQIAQYKKSLGILAETKAGESQLLIFETQTRHAKMKALNEQAAAEEAKTFIGSFNATRAASNAMVAEIVAGQSFLATKSGVEAAKLREVMATELLKAHSTLGAITGEGLDVFTKLTGVTPEKLEFLKTALTSKIPEMIAEAQEIINEMTAEQKTVTKGLIGFDTEEEAEEKKSLLNSFFEHTTGVLGQMTGAIGQMQSAMETLGVKGGGGFGKIFGAMAKVQAIFSLAQVPFEIAQAIAAFARYDFKAGTEHSLASVKFGVSGTAGKQAAAEIGAGKEHGGIVGGSSFTGDRILTPSNSGEGVLTAGTVRNIMTDLSGGIEASARAGAGGGGVNYNININGDALDADGLVAKITEALHRAANARTLNLDNAVAA